MRERRGIFDLPFLVKAVLTILLLCYPFLVYFGLSHFDIQLLGGALLVIILARFFLESGVAREGGDTKRSFAVMMVGSLICLAAIAANDPIYLKLYPVFVNIIFLSVFSYSLYCPPTMIERFARIRHKNLPQDAIAYLRKVTVVWCVFFGVNGLIAAVTAVWMSTEIWTLYNGLISYILMGILFAGEFIFRRQVNPLARAANE